MKLPASPARPRSRRHMRALRFLHFAPCKAVRTLVCVGGMLLSSLPAAAQDSQQPPAHISFVDGAASLDREGQTEDANSGVPFVAGDRLRTDRGRVELLFPDGSALAIDQFSAVELLSPTLLRMTEGRVLLTVVGSSNPSAAIRYQIDTPVASAMTAGPGEFRVALFSNPSGVEAELAVLRGFASLATERGSVSVRAGERSLARDNESPMYPQVFNSARFDAFDRWAEARRFDRTRTSASSGYLPSDLYMYGGTFDRYGSWEYEQPYGYVWYPSVAVDWRPYYHGYWSSIRPFGWTWIGFDSWSWPTHHYGRWGHVRNRWFWIPERRWAPAWVSWGAAPGYVSWCPLGFDNRPVFALSVTAGNPWAGWVVMPRTHFGGYRVNQWAVDSRRIRSSTPFVAQANSPVPPTGRYAIPRDVVAGQGATTGYAIPRNPSAAAPAGSGSQTSPSGLAGRAPANRQRAPTGDSPALANNGQVTTRGGQAVPRNPRSAGGDSPAATAPLPVDRSQSSAIRRRPSEERLTTPGGAAQPIERFRAPGGRLGPPNEPAVIEPGAPLNRQSQSEGRFRQPLSQDRPLPQAPALPQSAPLPRSAPLPQAAPLYRNPGTAIPRDYPTRPGAAEQPASPQPRSAPPPRWNSVPSAESPRVGTPRGDVYSRPAPSTAPAREAAPSAPPMRSPGVAVERSAPRSSGPPPSAAPSGDGGRNGGDGGGQTSGGGGRQRRP